MQCGFVGRVDSSAALACCRLATPAAMKKGARAVASAVVMLMGFAMAVQEVVPVSLELVARGAGIAA